MDTNEAARLAEYYPFDKDVLTRVGDVADAQRAMDWGDLSASIPDATVFSPDGHKAVEVLDIAPNDYESVSVYHLPMGNGLDENMAIRVATFAAAAPETRFIAFGNPGAPGQTSGRLTPRELATVWNGDLRPTIDPALQYLEQQGIERASHNGYSYGADKAASAAAYAAKYDQTVVRGIFMEPASVARRSLLRLGLDFASTAKPMEGYVQATASPAYNEARRHAAERNKGDMGIGLGLARLSNLAIAHALAKGGFSGHADGALDSQPELRTTIVWGTESELATNDRMLRLTAELQDKHGADRVRTTPIPGQKHAMGDDIFLQTAILLQATKYI